MSGLDKIISAVTPPVSDEKRAEARTEAKRQAREGDWLDQILEHHERIERVFAEVRAAADPAARRAGLKRLATLLTGHSIAEEAVVYPALARAGHKVQANLAYVEQAAAKMQASALEGLEPMSEDFLDKLGHLEGAVKTHMHQEESTWLLELKSEAQPAEQSMLTKRYEEEFTRYMSGGEAAAAGERSPLETRSFGAEAH